MLYTHCVFFVLFDSFHHPEMVKRNKKNRGSREPFIVSVLAIISFFCSLLLPRSSRNIHCFELAHCVNCALFVCAGTHTHKHTLHHGEHWKWRTYQSNIISFRIFHIACYRATECVRVPYFLFHLFVGWNLSILFAQKLFPSISQHFIPSHSRCIFISLASYSHTLHFLAPPYKIYGYGYL